MEKSCGPDVSRRVLGDGTKPLNAGGDGEGVARLDAFFDENGGRYHITSQSVTRAIEEERAKQSPATNVPVSESQIPKPSE